MHDVIRNKALSIECGPRSYVKAGLQLKELPDEREWTTGNFDKVLDLSYTNILNLPDSISNLGNLNSLVLRRCHKLRYLPSLAELKALKKLDLYQTAISEIPPQMEMLEKLAYLGLQSEGLKELPTGTLPIHIF
ncbi:hypothetical protein V6N12_023503 [Hibiscus sabdariffa]|uniref:Disease resistance protein n=1 Tax=Hibiscus sabdariffa TaxID=183260 RepID=A0ABR2FY06_9ROSI